MFQKKSSKYISIQAYDVSSRGIKFHVNAFLKISVRFRLYAYLGVWFFFPLNVCISQSIIYSYNASVSMKLMFIFKSKSSNVMPRYMIVLLAEMEWFLFGRE